MLTQDQINESIEQVKVHCDLLMPNYEMVSLRSALYTLGYTESDADQIIRYCAEKGFCYCIDPIIATKSYPDFKPEFPQASVCYWGPDQLKSRLWCVRKD